MPGPKPKYQPRFTEEEVSEARRVVSQYHASHSKVLRARTVLVLREHPDLPTAKLARRTGASYSMVKKWRRRWAEQGFSLEDRPRSGRPRKYSAAEIATVKALACQLPSQRGLPLSRFSLGEIRREVEAHQSVSAISTGTIWRILHEDAIRPWYHQCWLFPKDPCFLEKACPVLDLYQGVWEGMPLGAGEYVLSADEKTQLQILARPHETLPPAPGLPLRFENEYERRGIIAYLAALDVATGQIFGRVEESTGIAPFQNLVEQVMSQEPYKSADRVFWIVDNGSSHHPSTFPDRLRAAYANAIAVHLPLHASWLNQVEVYFSILQRKALTPRDLATRTEMIARILGFQTRYNQTARPFTWRFTREALKARMQAISKAA